MSTYPVDIKAKRITSTAANQEVFGGPGRFLGFSANCTAGAGTITLEDNGSTLAVFGTPEILTIRVIISRKDFFVKSSLI